MGELLEAWTGAHRPGGVALEGRSVRVVPLSTTHAEAIHEALAPAPATHWTYMPWGPFESVDSFRVWVESVVDADAFEFMAICSPQPLGVAAFMAIESAMGSVEVGGITFAPALQATTEATEAMYLMMVHAFDDLGFRRFEWKCDSLNKPSRSAAERLGFRYEGTFAQHRVVRGRNRDTAWFAITDRRWKDEVRPALQAWLAPTNFGNDGVQRARLQDLRADLTSSS